MIRRIAALAALTLIASLLPAGAKELKRFIARGYITIADTTSKWVGLDSVSVSLSKANDTISVPFKMLVGNDAEKSTADSDELRMMVYSGRGEYVLTLDREGYQPLMKEFKVTSLSQDVVWLGNMQMRKERVNRLKEVEVVATAIKMVMNGDTIVYNADAFNLAEGSMLDALVKQLPGAELSSDGQIKVNGRFVSSLLVNGQDFFKGDPQVALQNLPAYTVKNIKVYDKAAEDDYLTHESAKLSRREEEENIVMDVVLKKEYSVGLLGSVEGGYGLQNRYVGKAFAMLFTDKFKIAVFANANNLNNSDEFSFWNDSWESWDRGGGGRSDMQKAGITYNYDDTKRWKLNGDATYAHNVNTTETQTSTQQYFPGSKDLYSRESSLAKSSYHAFKTNHDIYYKGDVVYVNLEPQFNYRRSESGNLSRYAEFNEPPHETYRTESLDSVFSPKFGPRSPYYGSLIRRTWLRDSTFSENLSGSIYFYSKIAPPDMRGSFFVQFNGSLQKSTSDAHSLMLQHFGGANTSTDAPINSDRYRRTVSRDNSAAPAICYSHKWTDMGDEWSRSIELNTEARYNYGYTANTPDQFDAPADYEYTQTFLPSLTAPAFFVRNELNSYNSRTTSHRFRAQAWLNFNIERVAPVDTGFNPRLNIRLRAEETYLKRRLDYRGHTDDLVNRTDNFVIPEISINFSSGDKRRHTYLYASYTYRPNELPLNIFLNVPDSSNPLAIYTHNARGLSTPMDHRFWGYIGSYDRSPRQLNFGLNASYTKTVNALGQMRRFNPQTGVSTYSPCNIQGNWNASGSLSASFSFGPKQAFTLSNEFSTRYVNSVDYQTLQTEPERSEVHSTSFTDRLGLNYRFMEGGNITLLGGGEWTRGRSALAGFTPVNTARYTAELDVNVDLPADIEINTELNMIANRGFESSYMNRTQWIWNASATKSILKGNLAFKVSAFDILNQRSPYEVRVNAQGRYESWSSQLPRYVLFSVIYKFRHTPKKP